MKWDESKWQSVVWSDESTFSVTDSTHVNRVWRRPTDDRFSPKFTRKVVKHPASLMVWGCFSFHGTGALVFLERNVKMNQNNYLELLADHLPESFDKCKGDFFMQDGAPCHTAKQVKDWLRDCEVGFFEDWPGNSPDLNPIENLWMSIKRQLRNRDTSSLPKLRLAIQDIWDHFSPQELQNLASSVPRRLQQVIARKGGMTKY